MFFDQDYTGFEPLEKDHLDAMLAAWELELVKTPDGTDL